MRRRSQGSLTVEAALICPVFIIAILFFIYVIMWFQRAALVQSDIVSKARMAAAGYPVVDCGKGDDTVNDIVIPRIYKADFIPVNIVQKVVIRPFVGVTGLTDENEDPIVYVTKSGKVYHYDITCSYISVTTDKVNYSDITYRRNKSGSRYKACEVCCRNIENIGNSVYITDYGERFHSRADCTRIDHEILSIRISESGHMRACSKCGKGR